MQKTFFILFNIVGTLIFSACSFSEPLSCSSQTVKASTLKLVMDQVRDKETNLYIVKNPGIGNALLHNEVALRKMLVTGDIGYQEIVNANDSPKVQAILDAIDEVMSNYQVELKDIRTIGKDKELGIILCEAELNLKNDKTQAAAFIQYQVQPTEEGELYVQMNRLF